MVIPRGLAARSNACTALREPMERVHPRSRMTQRGLRFKSMIDKAFLKNISSLDDFLLELDRSLKLLKELVPEWNGT